MKLDWTAAPPILVPLPDAAAGRGGGALKRTPADFVVEEIPAYRPSGSGAHTYLWIEKEDVDGPALVREVARRLRVPEREVGCAGMKDRRAVTRQWLSVPSVPEASLAALDGPCGAGRITLLEASRHGNKLRTGHLHGNRFTIRVRERDPALDGLAAEALAGAARQGFANTFGPQRFGGGRTVVAGQEVLAGSPRHKRRMRALGVSAVQSFLFNHWLARRVADGLVRRALTGDVLRRRETGGVFVCDDPEVDTARLVAGELVLTGPLPGSRYRQALGLSWERDAALLAEAGLDGEAFGRVGRIGRGTRRPALAWPTETATHRDADGLVLSFALPSGCYASVLLGHVCGADLADG